MAMVRRNILQLNIFTVKYSSTVKYNVLIFSVVHHIIVPNDAKFLDSLAFMDPTFKVTVSSGQSPFSYREATTSEESQKQKSHSMNWMDAIVILLDG